MNASSTSKHELRREVAARVWTYQPTELLQLSAQIFEKIERDPHFIQAQVVLLYYSLPNEVNTHSFIRQWYQRKTILLPKVVGEQLSLHPYTGPGSTQKGAYGIDEPVTPPVEHPKIDLALVPGVAFDSFGRRLGRGKGYYDRLFAQLDDNIYKIGLAFPLQMVELVPTDEYDVKMDAVFTSD